MFPRSYRLFLLAVLLLGVSFFLVRSRRTTPAVALQNQAPAVAAPAILPAGAPLSSPSSAAVLPASPASPLLPVPAAPAITLEMAAAQVRALRRDLRWQEPMSEPAASKFAGWTRRYQQTAPAQRLALEEEGARLALERRGELARLIEENPGRALEVAIPVEVRRQMPLRVTQHLEEDVQGRGDLMVAASLPQAGHEAEVKSVMRLARLGGRDLEAFVGERRAGQPSRANVPLNGIALDGKMAVSDWPARVLEPVEVAAAKGALGATQLCDVSQEPTTVNADETVLDFGGTVHFYCAAGHAMQELANAAQIEGAQPLGTGFAPVANSAYTTGTKRMLIMRVDFSDYPGERVNTATLTTLINDDKAFWENMSYGKTSWYPVGGPVGQTSDITPTMRLPLPAAQYAGFTTMLPAAQNAARAAGYNLSNYDFTVVVTAAQPSVGFGGIAWVGAPGCWLANSQWNLSVSSHELGHNFGLNHSNSWDTTDGTVIGAGSSTEYGDDFDTMGTGSNTNRRHYGSRYKNYLGWLDSADVKTVTASGTYRIFAHDIKTGTGVRALKFVRTGAGIQSGMNNYWVDARELFYGTNTWANSGVFLRWTGNGNERSQALDTTPNSSNGKNDSPLTMGATFADPATNLYITPIAKIPGTPATAFDVVVNVGPFPGNRKPTLVSLTASATNVTTATDVTLTATATDADTADTLAYAWDFGDGTVGANVASVVHRWATNNRERLVRCTVSDMKGGTATASLVIRVGSPSTFSMTGKVSDAVGGVDGVTITAGTFKTTTNSDGSYNLVGLTAANYSPTATSPGKVYLPVNFINPVAIPPNKTALNFGTAPATPVISSLPPLTVNLDTPIGPIPFTVADKDTPLDLLTFSTATSDLGLLAPGAVVFGGSGANRTISVTPGNKRSGTATLTVICSDPDGNASNTPWVITVNAPPVLSIIALQAREDEVKDIDLGASFALDAQTDGSGLLFSLDAVANGTATLLADGRTLRFQPTPDFYGRATVQVSVTDQSSEPRLFVYYSFEGPDDLSDGKASDRSNFGRDGTLNVLGGGEIAFSGNDTPAGLAIYDSTALQLVENTDPLKPNEANAARILRDIPAGDLSFRDQSWTFSTWFKRDSTENEDLLWHVGNGTGHGSTELAIYCPAKAERIALSIGATVITNPLPVAVGQWHQVILRFTRTAANTGDLAWFVDGVLLNESKNLALPAFSQSVPVVFGGHNVDTSLTERWLSGKLDEIAIWSAALSDAEIARLGSMTVPHFSGLTVTGTLNLQLSSVNDAPTVGALPDVLTDEDAGPIQAPFTLSDDETSPAGLSVKVTSSNPELVPATGVALTGAGAARSVTISPLPNRSGFTIITLTVSDGSLSADFSFKVTVSPVNDAPTLSPFAALSLPENGSALLLPFEVADLDNAPGDLGVTAVSSNPALIDAAGLVIESAGLGGTLSVTPKAHQSGTATITVSVSDGALSASQSFVLTVAPLNDAPVIGPIANLFTAVDQPFGAVAVEIGDVETAAGALVLSLSSSNPKVVPVSAVVFAGTGSNRSFTLVPAAGQSGSATITLSVSDGQLTTTRSFLAVVESQGNLRVLVEGEGTVSSGFLGRSQREAGRSLTVVATPKTGYVFDGWTGGGLDTKTAALSFTMPESLELTARFIQSPFEGVRGSWSGLVAGDSPSHASSGLITFKTLPTGAYTGTLTLGGLKYSFKGSLNNDGTSKPLAIARSNAALLLVSFQVGGPAGEDKIQGFISDGALLEAQFTADRALFSAAAVPVAPLRKVPAAWLGKYTVLLEPGAPGGPLGCGYATMTVLPTGLVRATGKLADGTAISVSGALSKDGSWPFYLSLNKGADSLSGPVQWALTATTDCDGSLQWFKSVSSKDPAYPAGWPQGSLIKAAGAHYTAPRAAKPGLDAVAPLPALGVETATGNVVLSIGQSDASMMERPLNLSSTGKFSVIAPNTPPVQLTLVPATGFLTGSVILPGTTQKRPFNGALLQKASRGAGFHVGGGKGGGISLEKP